MIEIKANCYPAGEKLFTLTRIIRISSITFKKQSQTISEIKRVQSNALAA